jgi:hypothetical protein
MASAMFPLSIAGLVGAHRVLPQVNRGVRRSGHPTDYLAQVGGIQVDG